MKSRAKKAYAAAGVDIALGNQVKRGLQEKVRSTFGFQRTERPCFGLQYRWRLHEA
jgi:phosphoribosylaminoimidazole (AIR) synthetase